MNRNEKMILLGSCEGTEESNAVYKEIADLLAQQLPEIKLDANASTVAADPENKGFKWQASLGDAIKVKRLGDALWNTYKVILQAHSSIASKIRLVFKVQDSEGNFVKVQFADPYSDKSIYMYCFRENMESAFGRA